MGNVAGKGNANREIWAFDASVVFTPHALSLLAGRLRQR